MEKNAMIKVGKRIQEVRRCLGLSQKEFAEKAGINAGYLSEIENGLKKNPSFAVYYKISSQFNISLDYLVYGTGNMFFTDKSKYKSGLIKDVRTIEDIIWLMENCEFYNKYIMGEAIRYFYINETYIAESIKRSNELKDE